MICGDSSSFVVDFRSNAFHLYKVIGGSFYLIHVLDTCRNSHGTTPRDLVVSESMSKVFAESSLLSPSIASPNLTVDRGHVSCYRN